MFNPKTFLI